MNISKCISFKKERKRILEALAAGFVSVEGKLDSLLGIESETRGWRIKFPGFEISFKGNFMSNTTVDGGPFQLSVDKFVDDKGNTTTETSIPVFAIDDTTLATLVAPDPANPQGATLTLTGKVGAINITAAFGDQTKLGTPGNYLLQGSLGVAPGLAVAGSIEVVGPGVTA
jgi:hypothetical protein